MSIKYILVVIFIVAAIATTVSNWDELVNQGEDSLPVAGDADADELIVNEINCRHENLIRITNEKKRRRLASACARRVSFGTANNRNWSIK
ncbi:MAG: entry exclusion lipoprotein TrbK [Methylobacter sp.]|nr:MAG: entry exclusion lipoprotein TrbK [Methylobacter sp.]